jgi:hypothetical protein
MKEISKLESELEKLTERIPNLNEAKQRRTMKWSQRRKQHSSRYK